VPPVKYATTLVAVRLLGILIEYGFDEPLYVPAPPEIAHLENVYPVFGVA
jgi:hypothetical protein